MENYSININVLRKQLKERKVEDISAITKKYNLSEEAVLDLTIWSMMNYSVGYEEGKKDKEKNR